MSRFNNKDIKRIRYDGNEIKRALFNGNVVFELLKGLFITGRTASASTTSVSFNVNGQSMPATVVGQDVSLDISEVQPITSIASLLRNSNDMSSVNIPAGIQWGDSVEAYNAFYTGMQYYRSNLSSITGLGNIPWEKISKSYNMFQNAGYLRYWDIPDTLDLSNVTDAGSMFYYLGYNIGTSLRMPSRIIIGNKCTTMYNMFYNCKSLVSMDLSGSEPSSLTSMSQCFRNCTNLESVDFGDYSYPNTNNFDGCFMEQSKITTIDMSKMASAKQYNLYRLCYGLNTLTSIKLPTGSANNIGSIVGGCSKLQSVDFSTLNLSQCTTLQSSFTGCLNLEEIKGFGTIDMSKITSLSGAFTNTPKLTGFDISTWNIQNVTSMQSTFANSGLISGNIDLTGWDVSKCTDFRNLFEGEPNECSIDISGWDMSNSSNLSCMFGESSNRYPNIMSITTTGARTSNKLTNVERMFRRAKIQSIDCGFLNFENVTNSTYLFAECRNLTDITNLNFNPTNSVSISYMFYYDDKLERIDLDFSTITTSYAGYMFYYCRALKYIEGIPLINYAYTASTSPFNGCTSLTTIAKAGPITHSVWFNSSPLDISSAKVILNALQEPYGGAQTLGFSSTTMTYILADPEAQALSQAKTALGWTITA